MTENRRTAYEKHSMSYSGEYGSWQNMVRRCHYPNRKKRWVVETRVDGTRRILGQFETVEEAKERYAKFLSDLANKQKE